MAGVLKTSPRRAPVIDDGGSTREEKAGNVVKPVANAFRILRYLSKSGKPARAIQVARDLGINTSTCFNILRTMVGEGVIEFNALSKTYSLGLGIVKLVDSTLTDGQRVSVAKPLLHEVAERFRVTATLWRRIGADRIVLVSVEHSPSDLRIHMSEGQRLPMLMGATGRLVAVNANMTKAELRVAFHALRWDGALSFDAYWQQVQTAAQRGWAVDDGHFSRGIIAVAAPVFDRDGALAFTISAVMFRGQYDGAGIAKMGEELREFGAQLTDLLF